LLLTFVAFCGILYSMNQTEKTKGDVMKKGYIQWADGKKTDLISLARAIKTALKVNGSKVLNEDGTEYQFTKKEVNTDLEKEKFYCKILRETEKAILAVISGKEYWFPKSQVEYFERAEGDRDVMMLPAWLSLKMGVVNA